VEAGVDQLVPHAPQEDEELGPPAAPDDRRLGGRQLDRGPPHRWTHGRTVLSRAAVPRPPAPAVQQTTRAAAAATPG
jgi:hypothetical protein